MYETYYSPGEWNIVCDRCGRYRKIQECTLQMNKEQSNILVCTDTCLDVHQQQTDLKGIPDNQSVPLPRPGDAYTVYAAADPFGYDSLTSDNSPLYNVNGPNQPNN